MARGQGLHLGHLFDKEINNFSSAPSVYEHERHAVLFGPSGSGKFTRFVSVNLLSDCLNDRSVIVWDPKGEAAAVTAWHRANALGHEVKIIDPFGKLREAIEHFPEHREMIDAGLADSVGFNPLDVLHPLDPLDPGTEEKPNPNRNFYDDAAALAEALINTEGSTEQHWPESAQGLVVGLLMWEKLLNQDDANLENVRTMLTQDDLSEWVDKYENGKLARDEAGNAVKEWKQTRGLNITAERMVKAGNTQGPKGLFDIGGYEIASLAQRFQRPTDEIVSIRSTADTQTRWLLSKSMRDDLTSKSAIKFGRLKEKLTTVYVILPAERLRTHSAWLRLVLVSALRALYRPGGLPVTMLIDEMATLGRLRPLEDAFGLVRGYGVQLVGILQDLGQLKALYGERWESFLANAGLVQGLTPNDMTTAEWMSRRAGEWTIWAKGIGESSGGRSDADRDSTNWSQVQVRRMPAFEMFGMERGTGLAWIAGLADTVKFKTPNYWHLRECAARAGRNPYAGD